MAPRRGIIVSDDESAPAPSTSIRPRQSLTSLTSSRPSKSKSSREPRESRPTDSVEADLNLPIVSVLSPEDVGKIRVLETETFPLTQKLSSAMAMLSDAAVSVEELPVSAANQEVHSLSYLRLESSNSDRLLSLLLIYFYVIGVDGCGVVDVVPVMCYVDRN